MSLHWWACEHPERPPDALVRWHYAEPDPCRGCLVAAEAVRARHPSDPHVRWLVGMTAGTPGMHAS